MNTFNYAKGEHGFFDTTWKALPCETNVEREYNLRVKGWGVQSGWLGVDMRIRSPLSRYSLCKKKWNCQDWWVTHPSIVETAFRNIAYSTQVKSGNGVWIQSCLLLPLRPHSQMKRYWRGSTRRFTFPTTLRIERNRTDTKTVDHYQNIINTF